MLYEESECNRGRDDQELQDHDCDHEEEGVSPDAIGISSGNPEFATQAPWAVPYGGASSFVYVDGMYDHYGSKDVVVGAVEELTADRTGCARTCQGRDLEGL